MNKKKEEQDENAKQFALELKLEVSEKLCRILKDQRDKEKHDTICLRNLRLEILAYEIVKELVRYEYIKAGDYYTVQEMLSTDISKFIRETMNKL